MIGFPSGLRYMVFPTHVGVDRTTIPRLCGCCCIPHARGGGPRTLVHLSVSLGVFPTHVGVDRKGGLRDEPTKEYSPRTWGWTVKPRRRAGLASGIPHARGGGPSGSCRRRRSGPYSPRTWGWTRRQPSSLVGPDQYSPRTWGWTVTYSAQQPHKTSIPHARGGGPDGIRCKGKQVGVFPNHVGVDRPPPAV